MFAGDEHNTTTDATGNKIEVGNPHANNLVADELANTRSLENEELELHDYVNLQECHEMMQHQQQLLNGNHPDFTRILTDSSTSKPMPTLSQYGQYCSSCKNR